MACLSRGDIVTPNLYERGLDAACRQSELGLRTADILAAIRLLGASQPLAPSLTVPAPRPTRHARPGSPPMVTQAKPTRGRWVESSTHLSRSEPISPDVLGSTMRFSSQRNPYVEIIGFSSTSAVAEPRRVRRVSPRSRGRHRGRHAMRIRSTCDTADLSIYAGLRVLLWPEMGRVGPELPTFWLRPIRSEPSQVACSESNRPRAATYQESPALIATESRVGADTSPKMGRRSYPSDPISARLLG